MRLVCNQIAYEQTLDPFFAPAPTPVGVRLLLAWAAAHKLAVRVADLSVSFMHSPASDKVYARPPPGYRHDGYWWLLLTSMNGMQEASHDFTDFVALIPTDRLNFR
eukprot:13259348-Heterocapsa_arctica.AAC.1